MMEGLKPDFNETFEQTLIRQEAIEQAARDKYDQGEIPRGRSYEPLPDGQEEAFKEVVRREEESINQARNDLSQRRTIYG